MRALIAALIIRAYRSSFADFGSISRGIITNFSKIYSREVRLLINIIRHYCSSTIHIWNYKV